MSTKSNDNGRAFEYKCLLTLQAQIAAKRSAVIEENSSYFAAQKAWNNTPATTQEALTLGAEAATKVILELEPMILDADDPLTLLIQADTKGEEGDVRDILIIRRNIQWEIGLSLKHNHFAVKHSRLGHTLDFGKSWFNVPCSKEYWTEIKPIFAILEQAMEQNMRWSQLPNKAENIYVPLLQAFMNEVKRSEQIDKTVPRKMVEYLLGRYDFYKVVSLDKKKLAQIQAFNLHGTLSRPTTMKKSSIIVPRSALPSRIVSFELKQGSKTTVELYMDCGWQFSFRLHSASTKVEPSLKFDIQIVGMPCTVITINSTWY